MLLLRKAKVPLTLQVVLDQLAERGAALVIMVLTLPFCLPLHIPGLSTPFGLVIALLGLNILFGRPLWLPKSLLEREVSPAFSKKMIKQSLSLINKLKRWIGPRWLWISEVSFCKRLHGVVIVLLGLLLALPLPIPTTNLGFAWPLLFINIGLLEKDGRFISLGYLCFVLYVAALTVVSLSVI
ncbi:MAG: hypothetical protein K940chlam2_00527 [Chlamydiae bacterium]|nr:hypothetical protein [Chlamydiota bacterium]